MTDYPNWFNHTAKANFEKFLQPLAGKDGLRFLQLGVFTGDASLWLLENVLTGNDSWLVDVDTWKGSDEEEHKSMDFNDVYETYKTKVEPYNDKVSSFVGETIFYLSRTLHQEYFYDFIYIDADHTTAGVLMDAELSFPLLKSGGIMAFDDYNWGAELPPELSPGLGIDLFLSRHGKEYEMIALGAQVWIQKK